MPKKNFKNSYEYKRLLEILDDYWISEPDEAIAEIDMKFLHINGESQSKHIVWLNDKFSGNQIENARKNAWAFK